MNIQLAACVSSIVEHFGEFQNMPLDIYTLRLMSLIEYAQE